MFLDISKAFDRIWHQGLLYKLNQNGILGNLLETLTDFLKDPKQRVILNGQKFSWENVEDGVSEGSILGPLLFLIYINDLSDNLSTNVNLFADDTFSVVHDIATSSCDLNYDLNRVREWALLTIYKCFVRSHLDYGNIMWYRKCLFFKMFKKQSPKYLFDIIPQSNCQYRTRNAPAIPHFNVKHQFFKNTYFTSTINQLLI